MQTVKRALVVGAGIGGLTAGAALAQRGIETTVIEKKPKLGALGVGINQPGNALRALRKIGVLEECLEHGFQFDRWVFADQHGKTIVEVPSLMGEDGIPASSALPRPVLAEILARAAERAGAKLKFGITVEGITQDPDIAHVTFCDGSIEDYDIVVGFDGIRSQLRQDTFGPSYNPVHTGFSVWRIPLERHSDIKCATMFQGMGTKAGIFPLTDKTMYLLINTPEPGNPRFEKNHFDELLKDRLSEYTGLVGEIRENISGPEDIIYAPTEEVFLPSWYKERVIVLGDAAHACAPHGTQGAAMAIEDAVVLSEILSKGDPLSDALDMFMNQRYPRCNFVQDISRETLFREMDTMDQVALERRKLHMLENLRNEMQSLDTFLNQPPLNLVGSSSV